MPMSISGNDGRSLVAWIRHHGALGDRIEVRVKRTRLPPPNGGGMVFTMRVTLIPTPSMRRVKLTSAVKSRDGVALCLLGGSQTKGDPQVPPPVFLLPPPTRNPSGADDIAAGAMGGGGPGGAPFYTDDVEAWNVEPNEPMENSVPTAEPQRPQVAADPPATVASADPTHAAQSRLAWQRASLDAAAIASATRLLLARCDREEGRAASGPSVDGDGDAPAAWEAALASWSRRTTAADALFKPPGVGVPISPPLAVTHADTLHCEDVPRLLAFLRRVEPKPYGPRDLQRIGSGAFGTVDVVGWAAGGTAASVVKTLLYSASLWNEVASRRGAAAKVAQKRPRSPSHAPSFSGGPPQGPHSTLPTCNEYLHNTIMHEAATMRAAAVGCPAGRSHVVSLSDVLVSPTGTVSLVMPFIKHDLSSVYHHIQRLRAYDGVLPAPAWMCRVPKGWTVPVATARYWSRELLRALAQLHERGIMHRDVKLSNLLVDGDGRLFLADLGWGRFAPAWQVTPGAEKSAFIDDPVDGDRKRDAPLCPVVRIRASDKATGEAPHSCIPPRAEFHTACLPPAMPITGVPCVVTHRPPELLRYSCALDASKVVKYDGFAVDVYSAGCVLFRLATGKDLFSGTTDVEVLRAIELVTGAAQPVPQDGAVIMQEDPFAPTTPDVATTATWPLPPERRRAAVRRFLASQFVHDVDAEGRTPPPSTLDDAAAEAPNTFSHLLAAMLEPVPGKRLTAAACLTHPWLAVDARSGDPAAAIPSEFLPADPQQRHMPKPPPL